MIAHVSDAMLRLLEALPISAERVPSQIGVQHRRPTVT